MVSRVRDIAYEICGGGHNGDSAPGLVARHVRHYGLEEEGRAGIYRPWLQMNPKWLVDYTRAMDLIVKTSVAPEGLIDPIRKEVRAIDKDQPLANNDCAAV